MKKHLQKLLAEKQRKQAQIKALMQKSVDEGTTPDEESEGQISELESDIAVIEKNIERTKMLIADGEGVEGSDPIDGSNSQSGSESSSGVKKVKTASKAKMKGVGFAQFARAKMVQQLAAREGKHDTLTNVAKSMGFGNDVEDLIQKAALGTTTDSDFAASLVRENHLVGEFVEMIREATVFDKIKGMRAVPFKSKIPSQMTGSSASWVGEGAAKPITNPTYKSVEIGEHKLAAVVVYTQELMRRSDGSVDILVRDDLVNACAALVDTTFLGAQDETEVTPSGVFSGSDPIPSSGEDVAAYEADLMKAVQAMAENNLSVDGCYWVMSETRAMKLSLLRDALGNTYFNGMALSGERFLLGLPVVASETVGNKIGLIKPSEILLADDGGVSIDYSNQATLVDGSTTHNLWQENKLAIRAEKFITWKKRRPIASSWIQYQ